MRELIDHIEKHLGADIDEALNALSNGPLTEEIVEKIENSFTEKSGPAYEELERIKRDAGFSNTKIDKMMSVSTKLRFSYIHTRIQDAETQIEEICKALEHGEVDVEEFHNANLSIKHITALIDEAIYSICTNEPVRSSYPWYTNRGLINE